MTKDEAREALRAQGLRATAPRLAVLCALAETSGPISHSEMLARLGDADWDPATTYRTLVTLRDVGLAVVASRAGGVDRYALVRVGEDGHHHPHFACDDCGRVTCLPEAVVPTAPSGPWARSVASARVQLTGECPDCLAADPPAERDDAAR